VERCEDVLASDKAEAGLSGVAIGGRLSGAIEWAESFVDVVASDKADAGSTGIAIGGRLPGAAEGASTMGIARGGTCTGLLQTGHGRGSPAYFSLAFNTARQLGQRTWIIGLGAPAFGSFVELLSDMPILHLRFVCSLLKPRVSEQRCQLLPVFPKLMDTPAGNGTGILQAAQ
jgi:hypothetical protein